MGRRGRIGKPPTAIGYNSAQRWAIRAIEVKNLTLIDKYCKEDHIICAWEALVQTDDIDFIKQFIEKYRSFRVRYDLIKHNNTFIYFIENNLMHLSDEVIQYLVQTNNVEVLKVARHIRRFDFVDVGNANSTMCRYLRKINVQFTYDSLENAINADNIETVEFLLKDNKRCYESLRIKRVSQQMRVILYNNMPHTPELLDLFLIDPDFTNCTRKISTYFVLTAVDNNRIDVLSALNKANIKSSVFSYNKLLTKYYPLAYLDTCGLLTMFNSERIKMYHTINCTNCTNTFVVRYTAAVLYLQYAGFMQPTYIKQHIAIYIAGWIRRKNVYVPGIINYILKFLF